MRSTDEQGASPWKRSPTMKPPGKLSPVGYSWSPLDKREISRTSPPRFTRRPPAYRRMSKRRTVAARCSQTRLNPSGLYDLCWKRGSCTELRWGRTLLIRNHIACPRSALIRPAPPGRAPPSHLLAVHEGCTRQAPCLISVSSERPAIPTAPDAVSAARFLALPEHTALCKPEA